MCELIAARKTRIDPNRPIRPSRSGAVPSDRGYPGQSDGGAHARLIYSPSKKCEPGSGQEDEDESVLHFEKFADHLRHPHARKRIVMPVQLLRRLGLLSLQWHVNHAVVE